MKLEDALGVHHDLVVTQLAQAHAVIGLAVYLKMFAGLGLFFVGINLLSDYLKSYGKPYVSKIVHKLAGTDLRAILNGALAGAVTNSGKAVTFSLTGIVASGLLSSRKALPLVIGASFGSALLVLWVSIDFKMVDMLMLGTAGLYYQFGKANSSKAKFIGGVLLGLGLIFFGLELLRAGASAFKQDPDFMRFIASTYGYWIIALLLGAAAAFATQSGSTIAIVAISFFDAGLLDFEQAVMFVYGTNIGSGISTALLGLAMRGTSRQLVMFHALIKVTGAIILVPLLYAEIYGGIPLIKRFASFFAANQGAQIGAIYVMYEVISGAVLWILLTPISRWFARLWPPTHEESLSQLKYINRINFANLDSAAILIENEQVRMLQRAPRFFDSVRDGVPAEEKIDPKILYEANRSIHKEIEHRISECANLNLSVAQSACLLHRHSIQVWIESLDINLYELVVMLERARRHDLPQFYTVEIISALDGMMGMASQCVESEDPVSILQLIEMTEKPEPVIGQFKPKALATDAKIDTGAKKALLGMVFYYERIVWITNKLAHALASDQEEAKSSLLLEEDAGSTDDSVNNVLMPNVCLWVPRAIVHDPHNA